MHNRYKVGEERPSGNVTPLATTELQTVAEHIARHCAEWYGRTVIVQDVDNKDQR